MEANKRTLTAVFGQPVQFAVPLFQRPYVWEEEGQWLPLWENIRDLANRRLTGHGTKPHFLGAIVLDQVPVATGVVETRQVVDGQQRLTTLQLFLAAARDCARAHGAEEHSRAFATLIDNNLPLSTNADDLFKVWPTNADREAFRATMRAESPNAVRTLFGARNGASRTDVRIPDAYLFFYQSVEEFIDEDHGTSPEEDLAAIYHALQGDLLFVVIDLDDRDDAQIIFETMNALGTPLLPADLVKNFLFHSAQSRGDDVDRLHERYWEHFDSEDGFWREEVRQGRLKRPRIDLFLQHYLTLATNDEVLVGHLFTTFRDYVRGTSRTPEDHMAELSEYAAIYKKLNSFSRGTREGEFFYRLELLETSTVLPFLMEAFRVAEGTDDHSDLRKVLLDIESFLVRRMVCRLTTKNYNRLFLDLVQKLRERGTFDADAVRMFLLEHEGDSGRWPDDAEFSRHWLEEPMYTALVRRRLRMLLEAIEAGLHSDRTEVVHIGGRLTVEHLMPRAWHRHWPLPGISDEDVEAVQREDALHRIGNLTLLTKKLNPEISNGPWIAKRSKIREHSVLRLNQALWDKDDWTLPDMEHRARALLEVAIRVWPYPAAPEDSTQARLLVDA